VRKDPAQHLASLASVADAQNDVFAAVGFGTRAQDDRLYVARFDLYVACAGYGSLSSRFTCHSRHREHFEQPARQHAPLAGRRKSTILRREREGDVRWQFEA
jgi:hypothetical protein